MTPEQMIVRIEEVRAVYAGYCKEEHDSVYEEVARELGCLAREFRQQLEAEREGGDV